jgi:hypothetical protein
MKVLFVYNFSHPEYLADCVYHGLIDNGLEVYETSYPNYMMVSHPNPKELYGNGFTIFAKLNHHPRVETSDDIIDKIKSRFYDLIIYGCIYTHHWFSDRQCLDYLECVKEYYPKNKVHFLDGSDDIKNFGYDYGLNECGIIWKRELLDLYFGNPISFAIPESQIDIFGKIKKEHVFSPNINKPILNAGCDPRAYTFTDEKLYYREFAKSYYGYTCKKMCWDCMRHYEILANRCIPAFENLEECPPYIMVNFPKSIILEINRYSLNEKVHLYYDQFSEYLIKYTKENLTTKKLVQTLL